MNYFLSSRIASLVRREFFENKTIVILGPLFLVILSLICIIFTALFVDKVGTFFGGRFVGEFLQGLDNRMIETEGGLEIKLSDIEGGVISIESFEANETLGSLDNISGTKAIDDQLVDGSFKLNEILYYLHKLIMLVPLLISTNYLLGCLLHDRLDGSYFFWRSMPVSPKEEIIVKLMVALFAIPLIFGFASFLIQILSLLVFIFPIYRIGLDPISVILENFDISNWVLFLILDWLDRGIMLAPIFSFVILISSLAKRSGVFTSVVAIFSIVFLESVFLGSSNFIDGALHYLPWPISADVRIIDSPTLLVVGLIIACFFLSMAIYFRSRPLFLNN